MMSSTRTTRPIAEIHAASPTGCSSPASELLRHGFSLCEEVEVFAAARFRVGPGHVEAAEGVHADHRPRALPVQVEVPDVELALAALEPLAVARVERARQTVLRPV